MNHRAPVTLELFNDISCPWSHGALETSRRILDELAADPDVPALQLHWRFMRLKDMPREGGLPLAEYHRAIAGTDDPEVLASFARAPHEYLETVGARLDDSRFDFVHDPYVAHQVLAAVRDDERPDELPGLWSLARVLYAANFAHGLDISDLAVLRGAVERGGLSLPRRLWTAIADGAFADAPIADRARAHEVSLDGVPRIVVNGVIVPTWIDPLEVRTRLREAIAGAPQPA